MSNIYVHGYGLEETERLRDQAGSVVELLHGDTHFPANSAVLEAGCGVGAQTVTLLRRNPGIDLTAVDNSAASLLAAEHAVSTAGLGPVRFIEADLETLSFPPESFDHVFVCFVLEHLRRPADVLARLVRLLRPGGTLTAIEGDHGSAIFHPETRAGRTAIACQIELQRRAGGDPMIGRRLYPLLVGAGLAEVVVSPRIVSVDGSRPDLAASFTLKTFTAMIAGVREPALAAGLVSADVFDAGVSDLRRTALPDGTFSYTFFKGVGVRAS